MPRDNIGLTIGDPQALVAGVTVALDHSLAALAHTQLNGHNVLLTHHPLFYEPVRRLTAETADGAFALACVHAGVAHVSAHTNWDAAPGGISETMATALGLQEVQGFAAGEPVERRYWSVYVPRSARESVIEAMHRAGAGRLGNYERCAFWSPGHGTFIAAPDASPAAGAHSEVALVEEDRLEMTAPAYASAAIRTAIRQAHPYEEPAFVEIPLAAESEQPIARIGALPHPMSIEVFRDHVDQAFGTRCLGWGRKETIQRVAVIGGASEFVWRQALAAGADVLVTGEVRQHVALEASEAGLVIVAAGHYATEQPGTAALASALSTKFPKTGILVYEPPPGEAGRPW